MRPTDRGVVVKHKELIGPLETPNSSFTVIKRLRCNPGSATTFAWLSKMAPLYESFRFRRLAFVVTTRAPTTAIGSLVMAPDYDAADSPIVVSEQALFNNKKALDVPIWTPRTVLSLDPVDLNRLYKSHVCMSDERFANSSQDEKTIDPAQVYICSENPFAGAFGKLIVEYEVEFFIPQAPTDPVQQGGFQRRFITFNNTSQTAPIAGAFFQGTDEVNRIIQNLPFTVNTATVGRFTRDWQGLLSVILEGTGVSGFPTMQVGELEGVADQQGDVSQERDGFYSYNSLLNFVTSAHKVIAKAGQYLKIKAPANTTLTDLRILGGGTTAFDTFY